MESFWFGILIGVEVSSTILIGVIWFFFAVLGGKFNNWFILIIESIIAGIFWPITLIFLFKK